MSHITTSTDPKPVHVRDENGFIKYNCLWDDGGDVLMFRYGGYVERARCASSGYVICDGHADHEELEQQRRQLWPELYTPYRL